MSTAIIKNELSKCGLEWQRVLKILGSASSNTDVDNTCVMSFLNKCKSQSHHVSHVQQHETRKTLYIRTSHIDD